MPTGTALEGAPFASTIGPGVPRGPFTLQVHSAFRSALNLRLGGRAVLVTLVGADGPDLPQGIRLGSRPDFRGWGLRPGAEGFLGALELRLERSVGEPIRVDLSPARRAEPNPLAPIENLGAAFGACLPELETEQRSRACDLRVTDLLTSLAPPALPHAPP